MYSERYTRYQSSPNGVIERQLKELGVEYITVRPHERVHKITTGVVLDPVARCQWAFQQTQELVEGIVRGVIFTSQDVIFLEDFWHPGMEMIPYAASSVNRSVKMYAFNYAQSVDPHDFTYGWREWIRPFEKAWVNCLDGVFCAAKELEAMMLTGWGRSCPYHVVGLPYDHRVVWEMAEVPRDYNPIQDARSCQVIYTSRWDMEKNPEFFCQLIDAVMRERSDIKFAVCTGAPQLRSNNASLIAQALTMEQKYPFNFKIFLNQTKQEYFTHLRNSQVQFNCASQDFVSYTLLDATAFGCMPLYPDYLTFPDALHHRDEFLYEKGNVTNAKRKLYNLIDKVEYQDVSWVYGKYERSVHRMLFQMGFPVPEPLTLAQEITDVSA